MVTDAYTYPDNVGELKTIAAEQGTYPVTALLVSGYIWDDAHTMASDVSGDEISGSGYARIGVTATWTPIDQGATFEVTNPTFATFTDTGIDGVIFFADRGADSDSPLCAYVQLPSVDVTAEPLTCTLSEALVTIEGNVDDPGSFDVLDGGSP